MVAVVCMSTTLSVSSELTVSPTSAPNSSPNSGISTSRFASIAVISGSSGLPTSLSGGWSIPSIGVGLSPICSKDVVNILLYVRTSSL
eukprot:6457892-Pyramimonas_sp.AAC.1